MEPKRDTPLPLFINNNAVSRLLPRFDLEALVMLYTRLNAEAFARWQELAEDDKERPAYWEWLLHVKQLHAQYVDLLWRRGWPRHTCGSMLTVPHEHPWRLVCSKCDDTPPPLETLTAPGETIPPFSSGHVSASPSSSSSSVGIPHFDGGAQ